MYLFMLSSATKQVYTITNVKFQKHKSLLAALCLAVPNTAESCQVWFPSNLVQCQSKQIEQILRATGYNTCAVASESRASQLNRAQ